MSLSYEGDPAKPEGVKSHLAIQGIEAQTRERVLTPCSLALTSPSCEGDKGLICCLHFRVQLIQGEGLV